MEFELRAEIKRAEAIYEEQRKMYAETWTRLKSASLVESGVYNMKCNAENTEYKNPIQRESDLLAVRQLYHQVQQEHGRALRRYNEEEAMWKKYKDRLRGLEDDLADLTSGRKEWREASRREKSEGDGWREFDRPRGGRSYYKQTYPPTSPQTPPRNLSPPPRPTRSRSQSPRPWRHRPRTPSPPPPQPKQRPSPLFRRYIRPHQYKIDGWFDSVAATLADPSKIDYLPAPPFRYCPHSANCPLIVFDQCKCVLEDLFKGRDMKADRLMFHPDKWSGCREEVRAEVQREAGEVFKVVDCLWKRQKETKD